ncbi:MAG: hypothetical protein UHN47_05770 [Lachnospiraceae bacterium]|nr:hypothetical protein [Lachnospiraceae bacterium]
MQKKEIVNAKDNELITEYVSTYASYLINFNLNRGTKQHAKHCHDLEAELLRRGILTEEDIERLNV